MPYSQNSELPDSVTNALPAHAQDIYRKAFNSAWDEYRRPAARRDDASREEVSHRVAWQAVKQTYHKDDNGQWQPK
jgi:cation transport regulator